MKGFEKKLTRTLKINYFLIVIIFESNIYNRHILMLQLSLWYRGKPLGKQTEDPTSTHCEKDFFIFELKNIVYRTGWKESNFAGYTSISISIDNDLILCYPYRKAVYMSVYGQIDRYKPYLRNVPIS